MRFLRSIGSSSDGSIFTILTVVAIFALSRTFGGILGDNRIYIARALADLDPNGIGRDFTFVNDEQSQFSIFRFVAVRFVDLLGPSSATIVFTVLAMIAWFFAMLFLAKTLAPGRAAWLVLIFVAILPSSYGPYMIFHFGENGALPRPFAEAAVLAALAALVEQRWPLAVLMLLLASLLHPLMALPGVFIFFIFLCAKDRRWIAVAIALCLGAFGATAMGLPFLQRLVTVIDPDWLSILRSRNPYLFLTLWPSEAYGLAEIQFATLIVAAHAAHAKARLMFLGVAAAGFAGLAITIIFGDWMSLLLIVQAQSWRWLWLMGVLAAAAFALCAVDLWKAGAATRLSLAFLSLGWMCWDDFLLASTGAAGGATVYFLAQRYRFRTGLLLSTGILILVILFGLARKSFEAMAFIDYATTRWQGASPRFSFLWNVQLLSVPIAIGATLWALRSGQIPKKPVLAAALSAVSIGAVISVWDDRGTARKLIDSGEGAPELTAMLAERSGDVLWLGSEDTWYLLGRPSWASGVQGASIVFSRPLAMLWQDRVKTLIDNGLAEPRLLTPWPHQPGKLAVQLSRGKLERLCSRADAPAWIIAPLEQGMSLPEDLVYRTWQPVKPFNFVRNESDTASQGIERYAVLSCTK